MKSYKKSLKYFINRYVGDKLKRKAEESGRFTFAKRYGAVIYGGKRKHVHTMCSYTWTDEAQKEFDKYLSEHKGVVPDGKALL